MSTHSGRPCRSRYLSVLAGLCLLSACGSDDSGATGEPAPTTTGLVDSGVPTPGTDAATAAPTAPAAPAEKPLYLAASWVDTDDGTQTYISLLDSIDTTEKLDFGKAIEVGGYGDAWVIDGMVFVAEGESPTITRYKVEGSQLVKDVSISFANYGVSSVAFYDNEIVSATKAYVVDSKNRQYIAWNPSKMEILQTMPWPELEFPAGWEPFQSYTDRGGATVGKYWYHAIYQHEGEDFIKFGDSSVVGVYDTETDKLVKTIDVPCPMADVMTVGGDGKLYLSAWTYVPLSVLAGYTQKNCVARIDPTTQTLDADYTVDVPTLTGGEQGSGLRLVSGNEALLAVFHGTGIQATPGIDLWDLDKGENDWELYSIDLTTRVTKPTGIKFGDGSYYESHIDGRYFVFLPGGPAEAQETQVYEHTANGYVPKFKARGWMSRLFKVR